MLKYVLMVFLILLIMIIMLTRIKVLLEYVRKDADDHIVFSIFYLKGLIKYKYEISLMDLYKGGFKFKSASKKGKKEKTVGRQKGRLMYTEIKNWIKDIKYKAEKLDAVLNYLKLKLLIEQFRLDVYIGTGEANYTGIVSGVAWSIAGLLNVLLENNFRVMKKHINIKSDFKEKIFEIDLYCIFSIKIAHIINMVLKYGKLTAKKKIYSNKSIGGDIVG